MSMQIDNLVNEKWFKIDLNIKNSYIFLEIDGDVLSKYVSIDDQWP